MSSFCGWRGRTRVGAIAGSPGELVKLGPRVSPSTAAILIVLHLAVTALAAAPLPRRGDASGLVAAEPLT
jgi:hypothetical protein